MLLTVLEIGYSSLMHFSHRVWNKLYRSYMSVAGQSNSNNMQRFIIRLLIKVLLVLGVTQSTLL